MAVLGAGHILTKTGTAFITIRTFITLKTIGEMNTSGVPIAFTIAIRQKCEFPFTTNGGTTTTQVSAASIADITLTSMSFDTFWFNKTKKGMSTELVDVPFYVLLVFSVLLSVHLFDFFHEFLRLACRLGASSV